MNASIKLFVFALAVIPATQSLQAEERRGGIGIGMIPKDAGHPTADSITDKQFLARRETASGGLAQPKPMPPVSSGYGLLEMSTVLQSGQEFALLPKGSVIWCPPGHQANMVSSPSGKFTEWLTFFSANRGWITTLEVTQDQVSGKHPLPSETLDRLRKGNLLVVATFQGGPISMPALTP